MVWLGHRQSDGAATSRTDSAAATLDAPLDVELRTVEIGRRLLDEARQHRGGFFSARFWNEQLIDWAMKDPGFKVALFRFIDVFPMLRTPEQIHDCLSDYLGQPGITLPPGMDLGLKAGGLAKGLLAKTIASRIAAMANNFIAGTDAAAALPSLRKLWEQGVAFSVDLLGEACVSDEEARTYQRRYLDLLGTLPGEVARWPADPRLENDHLGPIPRTTVSIKISSLCARTDAIDFEGSLRTLTEAIRPIAAAAARNNVMVYFDMEQAALKDLTISLFERCCDAMDFPAGLALQAYLRSGMEDAGRLIDWAGRSGRQVTVRLIKGAYWDYEVIQAERQGWPVPVWTQKRETDACFERMAERFVASTPRRPGQGGVKLALGSHNIRSIAAGLALAEKYDLPESAIEVQKLYGMADPLRKALGQRGLRVREYVPVGEMIPGMAYLVRRLLENTSNQSWLRAGFAEGVPDDVLLASPHAAEPGSGSEAAAVPAAQRHALSPAIEGLGNGLPMVNEPARDFSQAAQRERFARAVVSVAPPAVHLAMDVAQCRQAIAEAAAAEAAWRDRDAVPRSQILLDAAARMRDRRDPLAAIMIREAGKTWREADADVCEAIDFCEYYARWAVALLRPQQLGHFVGELNYQTFEPRGVTAVISPWNFPLAICAGMTTAALAVGNTVVVKPSTHTRGIAQVMCEILWQSGVPPEVLHFLPGSGREVGDALVRDPRVAIIAFTGSKEVGLDILRAAGETSEGQSLVKKVVCEMGGKNAIIVDDSADLDEAVLGVRQSAFGYAGQKCSACSRAIVLEGVHDAFLRRLVESTRTLAIGDPADPGTDLGPVIDEAAAEKIGRYIEIGKVEGRLELGGQVNAEIARRVGKPLVAPHIFSGIEPHHRLANEEIFGPVLAVLRARTFDEALQWANATAFKLTGGVFTREPSHLEAARRRFRVGNLYLNRGITGALVGRQPFGGFGLSGVGTKAGGPDYLYHFVQPRCSTENTMRHGFAPGLD